MRDINKIILVGRLGGDPIQRQTKSGTSVVQLSVATARRVHKEGVENAGSLNEDAFIEETQWHRVVTWGRQAEACAQYLRKGHTVYVEGFLKSRQYEDKNGLSKLSVEVQAETVSFLGNPSRSSHEKPVAIEAS
jgi:single-strand DNA-binding protein